MDTLKAFLYSALIKYDLLIIIPVLVILILVIRKFCRTRRIFSTIAEKRFACPNCGLIFHIKWYKLLFNYSSISNCAIIKCPGCGIKDQCKRIDDPDIY